MAVNTFAMTTYERLRCLILIFFLSIYSIEISANSKNIAQLEVTIPQGTLRGTTLASRNNRNISAFFGIPFAQPPIGNLRFANPVAADRWDGILDATADSSLCPQMINGMAIGDEDCLYVNIYVPQIMRSSLLPVMVYIHGGAFKQGTHSSSAFGPQYIMDEDVVLVLANYRLGPLGFLSTGDEVASGNWGLKDQVLALKWVQQNIEYFGGDPDQVTLFGESAGGSSVHLLSLSDTTIGLFHRYIMQSGSALSTWAHRPRAAYSVRAFELGEFVGCSHDTSDFLISCLRTIDSSDIIATESLFAIPTVSTTITWGPTDEPDIEGAILTDSPSNLVAAGKIRDLPCISGVVRDEGLLQTAAYYENEELLSIFLENYDEILPRMLGWTYLSDSGAAWVKATKSYYFNNDLTISSELLENLTALCGDAQFNYPAHYTLQQHHALAMSRQYFYIFNYRGTYSHSRYYGGSVTGNGVAHGDGLTYLFLNRNIAPDGNFTLSESDNKMVDAMVQLFTSFAINGKPKAYSGTDKIIWKPYSDKDDFLRIGNEYDTASEMQCSFYPGRMEFWASIVDTVE